MKCMEIIRQQKANSATNSGRNRLQFCASLRPHSRSENEDRSAFCHVSRVLTSALVKFWVTRKSGMENGLTVSVGADVVAVPVDLDDCAKCTDIASCYKAIPRTTVRHHTNKIVKTFLPLLNDVAVNQSSNHDTTQSQGQSPYDNPLAHSLHPAQDLLFCCSCGRGLLVDC